MEKSQTPAVTDNQGIDLDAIDELFLKHQDMNPEELSCYIQAVKDDVLELTGHVREDGLLDRVSNARKDLAEEILPSEQ